MSAYSDKINKLKLELQSATTRNLRNRKMENSLRSLERSLTEDISLIKSECDLMLQQMQDLKQEISESKNQLAITEICKVTEKSKMENHIFNMNAHKQRFDVMFMRERKLSELHHKELKDREAEEEEIERQKINRIEKGKAAEAIENECDTIERECEVLVKRNKAIMIKLRRKLLEAEDTRLELMRKKELVPPFYDNNSKLGQN